MCGTAVSLSKNFAHLCRAIFSAFRVWVIQQLMAKSGSGKWNWLMHWCRSVPIIYIIGIFQSKHMHDCLYTTMFYLKRLPQQPVNSSKRNHFRWLLIFNYNYISEEILIRLIERRYFYIIWLQTEPKIYGMGHMHASDPKCELSSAANNKHIDWLRIGRDTTRSMALRIQKLLQRIH